MGHSSAPADDSYLLTLPAEWQFWKSQRWRDQIRLVPDPSLQVFRLDLYICLYLSRMQRRFLLVHSPQVSHLRRSGYGSTERCFVDRYTSIATIVVSGYTYFDDGFSATECNKWYLSSPAMKGS